MVICIDVGNTDMVAGIFTDDSLSCTLRFPYEKGQSEEYYYNMLEMQASLNDINTAEVTGCLLCCVAINTSTPLAAAMKKLFGTEPVVFKNDKTCRLSILTENPMEVGTDIIASCMAAKNSLAMPCVVIDMGTATTLTAMDKNGAVLGVSILTGVFTSMWALREKTGLPFEDNIDAKPKAIGTNTQKSIDSGMLLGAAYAIDGLVTAFEEEIGQGSCSVVATGGVSQFIVPLCRRKIALNQNLLLEGLYCYYKNSIME